MIIGLGDILRLIVFGNYLGQQCLNVFHYRFSSVEVDTFDLEDVCQGWIDTGAVSMSNGQGVGYNQTSVKVINLSQPFAPFFEKVYTQGGVNGGVGLPSNVTASFKLLVSTSKTKAGGKRVSGLATSQVTGNALTSAGVSSLTPFRNFLLAPMIIENDAGTEEAFLYPIVLKRYTTEYPTESDWQDVTGCILSPYVGSQNSRKEGYGS